MIDAQKIKKDFPLFKGQPDLVYLDSSATSLKPQIVIDAENDYYQNYSANIYRGIYKISEKATAAYENTRKKVQHFIHSPKPSEIIFVRNTTEAINLVASSWGEKNIVEGDEIIVSIMEHHANFVPWQQLCVRKKAHFSIVGITPDGQLHLDELYSKITSKTKLVAITHVSNVLGTINPIADIVSDIKKKYPQCIVLIDGAQAVPHMEVDVSALGCDFYAFSSHKMLGPTGVGVLWGRQQLLDAMDPYQFGGEMIEAVYPDHTIFEKTPLKFEAGTPNIAGVIALGAAIDYLGLIGMSTISAHEQLLCSKIISLSSKIDRLKIIGDKNYSKRSGIMAFTIEGLHPHDIAQVLDSKSVCIRAGHHCAMPLHLNLGLSATARASWYLYTTEADIERFIEGINYCIKTLS